MAEQALQGLVLQKQKEGKYENHFGELTRRKQMEQMSVNSRLRTI